MHPESHRRRAPEPQANSQYVYLGGSGTYLRMLVELDNSIHQRSIDYNFSLSRVLNCWIQSNYGGNDHLQHLEMFGGFFGSPSVAKLSDILTHIGQLNAYKRMAGLPSIASRIFRALSKKSRHLKNVHNRHLAISIGYSYGLD